MTKTTLETQREALHQSLEKCGVPEHLHCSIIDYVMDGCKLGGFLEAVITNNLMGAFRRADAHSLAGLKNLVGWLYNDAPAGCHGSMTKYNDWLILKLK